MQPVWFLVLAWPAIAWAIVTAVSVVMRAL